MGAHAPGMRERFFDSLIQCFRDDPKLMLVSADDGGSGAMQIFKEFPDRAVTVGIAEQQMIGFCAGLAIEGYKPIALSIAPFATLRCLEFIKLDLCAMDLPVTVVGVGAGYSYDIAGPTHHTVEDISAMRVFPHLEIYSPCDGYTAAKLPHIITQTPHPKYVRIDRGVSPQVYTSRPLHIPRGFEVAERGSELNDVVIIATGRTVHEAVTVSEYLLNFGVSCGVIDLFRLKPVQTSDFIMTLIKMIRPNGKIVTYEEHQLNGGLGSIVCEILADNGFMPSPVLRIGQEGNFAFELGGRDVIWQTYGLDSETVTKRILTRLGRNVPPSEHLREPITPSKATGY